MVNEFAGVTASDSTAIRMQWDKVAGGWSKSSAIIRPWLQQATQAMLSMGGVKAGSHVLDVAAGAGDQTLDIAERVGSRGSVLATDLSPGILEFALQRATAAGHSRVEIRVSDGENLLVEDGRFDAVVCRLGLMLFNDPQQGLREMARVLKPGGGACTMVFGAPQSNPCVAILMSTALRHAGMAPRAPYEPGGLLSLGQPGLINTMFKEAGLRDVATNKIAAPFRLPTVKDYMKFIRTSAGPVVQIVHRLEPIKAAAAWDDMETQLAQFQTPDGWEGPNELLLTAGRR